MYTIISCVHKMSGSIRCRNTGTGSLSHLTCCFSTTSLMQPCAHKSVWGDCLSTVPAAVRLFQKCIIIIVTNITTTNSDLIVVDARVIAHAADSTQLFQSRVFTGFDLLAILVPEHTTKTCTYIYIYIHMQIQPVTYTHTVEHVQYISWHGGETDYCWIPLIQNWAHKLAAEVTVLKQQNAPFSVGLVTSQTDLDYCFLSVYHIRVCLFFEQVHITWEACKCSRWTFPYCVSLVTVFSSRSKHHNFHLIICIHRKCQCSHFSKLHQRQDNFQGVIKRCVLAR